MKKNRPLEPLCVAPHMSLLHVMLQLDKAVEQGYIAGIALVTDEEGRLKGTITDGDIRRASSRYGSFDLRAEEVMNPHPITFPASYSFRQILEELPLKLKASGRKSRRFLSKIVLVDEQNRPQRVLPYHRLWEQRVALHRHIVVLGMGYVGFTLALVLAEQGFFVTGYDVQSDLITRLQKGCSHVHERGLDAIFRRQLNKNFFPSMDMPADGEVYIIAVGTPVQDKGSGVLQPDLTSLRKAAEMVGQRLRPGDLVVLRSTVPVGSTREVVLPVLEEQSGLEAGVDFFLSFAPERTAEGKALEELRNLPQLIGGVNEESVEATAAMFRDITPTIVRLDSLEQAELAKLLNNSFRDYVFAFSNQAAQLAAHYGVDVVRTIRAANQAYPRQEIPLPSPGVGGPCLTKDPYIFAAAAEKAGIAHPLFLHARRVNETMVDFVVERVLSAFRQMGKEPEDAPRVLVCGLAFKGQPETADLRHSTSIAIAHRLLEKGLQIVGHDPVASAEAITSFGLQAAAWPEAIRDTDAVLFLNNHLFYKGIDLEDLLSGMRSPALVLDAWHLFEPEEVLAAGPCVYLGLSFSRSNIG